jgi:hypothetical protein
MIFESFSKFCSKKIAVNILLGDFPHHVKNVFPLNIGEVLPLYEYVYRFFFFFFLLKDALVGCYDRRHAIPI